MIIPAILENNWEDLQKKLDISCRFAKTVHIDFIDGEFVNNKNYLELDNFAEYKQKVDLEAHLMVKEPIDYLEKLEKAGFSNFIGHVEHMSDQVEFVTKGEELGGVGLALDLETPLNSIEIPLDDLDQILLMCVRAGKSGQDFNHGILSKIERLRKRYYGKIEVDGGINNETLLLAKKAGANNFCVTTALFKEDPSTEYEKLTKLL